jgi:RNA polymerase sigma factor (sigma-70 family)
VIRSVPADELIRRCSSSGDYEAWEEFVRRFHRPIAASVMRAVARFGDFSPALVDDLIQDTYLKLCSDNFRVLRDFELRYSESFMCLLQVIATNVVRDHFKACRSGKRGFNRVDQFEEEFDPAAHETAGGSSRAIERSLLIQQVENCLNDCAAGEESQRDRKIFWLYYRVGLSAAAIAGLPEIGLSTKGVESSIHRLTKELRERLISQERLQPRSPEIPKKGISPAQSF